MKQLKKVNTRMLDISLKGRKLRGKGDYNKWKAWNQKEL